MATISRNLWKNDEKRFQAILLLLMPESEQRNALSILEIKIKKRAHDFSGRAPDPIAIRWFAYAIQTPENGMVIPFDMVTVPDTASPTVNVVVTTTQLTAVPDDPATTAVPGGVPAVP